MLYYAVKEHCKQDLTVLEQQARDSLQEAAAWKECRTCGIKVNTYLSLFFFFSLSLLLSLKYRQIMVKGNVQLDILLLPPHTHTCARAEWMCHSFTTHLWGGFHHPGHLADIAQKLEMMNVDSMRQHKAEQEVTVLRNQVRASRPATAVVAELILRERW